MPDSVPMSDSQSQERPAKRLKLAPHPQPAAPQPGPQLRFIKPVPFPSVVAPPRSMVNVPLSWVNVVSTTRPKRARVREPEPEPEVGPETEPERELRHGRGRRGGRGGRGGRRKRARGYASTSESGTPQTEEAEPVGDAELETASSPAPSESVSSQMSTQTSTKMSPEYSPEASSEASSELSFDMVSEALSEATYEPMELEATTPMATVVMSQDINACKSTASQWKVAENYPPAYMHTCPSIRRNRHFPIRLTPCSYPFVCLIALCLISFLRHMHHSSCVTHHTPPFVFPPRH